MTAVPTVPFSGVGESGWATPADVVPMGGNDPAKPVLVNEKLAGLENAPCVIFCTETVGMRRFVNVHTSALAAAVAVAFSVMVAVVAVGVANVTLAAAVPVQVPETACQPVGTVSVIVVVVAAAVSVLMAPATATPGVTVAIESVQNHSCR